MDNKNPSTKTLGNLRQELFTDAELSNNFLALTISSCIIATLGLLMNSAAVIIGAMVIAPLLMPLRGLAFAALDADVPLLKKSVITLIISTLISVIISALLGAMLQIPAASFGTEILARTQPNLADLGVALAAGFISGFAKVRPQISDALAGTAIAVALMPPLCVVGIAISQGAWIEVGGSFLLYLTNLLGITLACVLVFIWGGYARNSANMRRALGWFLAMTSLLVLPLFLSLYNLIQRGRLENIVRENLERRTITFGQQTRLSSMDIRWSYPWSRRPSKLTLQVQAIPDREVLTPTQVRAVEEFLSQKMGRKFDITVQISQFLEITSEEMQPESLIPNDEADEMDDLIIDPATGEPTTTSP